MLEISTSGIADHLKKNHIVVVEFQRMSDEKCRAVFKGFTRDWNKVKTVYGTVEPKKIFAFSSAAEAMNFVNEVK